MKKQGFFGFFFSELKIFLWATYAGAEMCS
jgi:hypothetical protein